MIVNIDISGQPLLYIKYEHLTVKVQFNHTLNFCVPSAFNTDTYSINRYSWWVLCDSLYESACEIGCVNHGNYMYLSYHKGNTQSKYLISQNDAKALFLNIEKAIHLAGFPIQKRIPVRILKPADSSMEYRVYPIEYRVERISSLVERRSVATLSIPLIKRSTNTTIHV